MTNPDLFAEVEKLRGERATGLDILSGRAWDAVVDTCGYDPHVVRQSVELIASPYYLFVSTRSVYADLARSTDEDAPLHGDVDSDDVSTHYGALKAMCERVVEERPGSIVRPGLIVGPHDPTGRFTYWPHRIARGGDVLAPGTPSEPVTWIDVRDLAEWIIRLCEQRINGVFNAVDVGTWGELLDARVRTTGSAARLVWVPSEWLVANNVGEWMELPLWVSSPESLGIHRVENTRAISAGLTFRPLEETIRATLSEATPTSDAGPDPAREATSLRAHSMLRCTVSRAVDRPAHQQPRDATHRGCEPDNQVDGHGVTTGAPRPSGGAESTEGSGLAELLDRVVALGGHFALESARAPHRRRLPIGEA